MESSVDVAEKRRKISDELQTLREKIKEREDALLKEAKALGCTGLNDDLRLNASDLAELQALYDTPEFAAFNHST